MSIVTRSGRVAGLVLAFVLAPAGVRAEQTCEGDPSLRSTPTSRFQDNGDGTVTDLQSTLMWLRCSAGQQAVGASCEGQPSRMTWAAARALAEDINQRGQYFFNDWRLPSLRDLATITERHCSNPRVNLSVFPSTPAAFYWTASSRPVAGSDTGAYALSFGAGGIVHAMKDEVSHVRLVRTGP